MADPPEALKEGMILADRYRLERLIGEGGMGAVWSAQHVVTRKHVAIKVLHAGVVDEEARSRFLREARAASSVNHPNIVQIHDVLMHGESPVIVMELLRGESLGDRLAQRGSLPLAQLEQVLGPVIDAMEAAHRMGIVHRDLKPDNIFLMEGAAGLEVRLLDFGIAKLTAAEGDAAVTAHLTQTGAMLGTPYYMSPEQAQGLLVDSRTDIWALGMILYECVSGVRPVQGTTLAAILLAVVSGKFAPIEHVAPDCPSGLAATIGAMIAVDPARRTISLQTVRASLRDPYTSFVGPSPTNQAVTTPVATVGTAAGAGFVRVLAGVLFLLTITLASVTLYFTRAKARARSTDTPVAEQVEDTPAIAAHAPPAAVAPAASPPAPSPPTPTNDAGLTPAHSTAPASKGRQAPPQPRASQERAVPSTAGAGLAPSPY